ncbi:MAG: tyrosine-type recombinase/integrase [Actinobacteria bacterium]|nr:tyrosine-type recombinase/integrase [Actinomycetota bacterium]MCA1697417.1 tyrosine-type recombinase/integrase [Actinomycetota bacterium]
MQQLGDVGAAQAEFERWLERQPLAVRTKGEYRRNVRVFLDWLASGAGPGWDADPLTDRLARDHAARDFRRWLKVERRAAASTVNLALASLDALYRQRGLGNPNVRREQPARAAPRALEQDEQRQLLRACERASARDRALVVLMLFTALRLSEALALDLDDVQITARKGRVVARSGKGDLLREVPLNPVVRQVLEEWLAERATLAGPEQSAVFLARAGARLSLRAADSAVRKVARAASLELSAHVLRHTCLTGLVRRGTDLVTVAELAGHSRVETTRRYSLPSEADRQQAVDDLQIDY